MKHSHVLVAVLFAALALAGWFMFAQTKAPATPTPEVTFETQAAPIQKNVASTPARRVTLGSFGISTYEKQGNALYCNQEVIPGADSATFVYLETYYAKDKNHVYTCTPGTEDGGPQYWIIEGADPATFSVLGGIYSKDATQVFVMGRNRRPFGVGESIDIKTFSVFTSDSGYAKDKNNVYIMGTDIIKGADPNTFVPTESSEDLYFREYFL